MGDLFPSLSRPIPKLLDEFRRGPQAIAGEAFELLQAEIAGAVGAQILACIRRSVSDRSIRSQLLEDAEAETWCAVIGQRDRFVGDDLETFRRWVCGIARNKANQAMRLAFGRRECALAEHSESFPGETMADAIEENVTLKRALVEALDRAGLTERQRTLAVLVLEAYSSGCATAVEAYEEAAGLNETAGWMRIKEVWLGVRKKLRTDPGLITASEFILL
jgi:DNA-directed RNA polymerase specialized sigma24 family protein